MLILDVDVFDAWILFLETVNGLADGGTAAGLLLVDLNDVILLHLESFRSFIVVDAPPVKQKPEKNNFKLWLLWKRFWN